MLILLFIFLVAMSIAAFVIVDTITDLKLSGAILKIHSRNNLRECNICKRLYRYYQIRDRESKHQCPHCCKVSYHNEKIKEAKWMNVHPDCPKTNLYEHFKMMRMYKKIEKNKQDVKDQEYFEEYNKMHVDLKWIENLTKK